MQCPGFSGGAWSESNLYFANESYAMTSSIGVLLVQEGAAKDDSAVCEMFEVERGLAKAVIDGENWNEIAKPVEMVEDQWLGRWI